jgi:hypothetical protein
MRAFADEKNGDGRIKDVSATNLSHDMFGVGAVDEIIVVKCASASGVNTFSTVPQR